MQSGAGAPPKRRPLGPERHAAAVKRSKKLSEHGNPSIVKRRTGDHGTPDDTIRLGPVGRGWFRKSDVNCTAAVNEKQPQLLAVIAHAALAPDVDWTGDRP